MARFRGKIQPNQTRGEYLIDISSGASWLEAQDGCLVNLANVSYVFSLSAEKNAFKHVGAELYAHIIGAVPEDADVLLWRGTDEEVRAMMERIKKEV